MEEFHKVRRLPPYVFEQVNRLKATARANGVDIIDLGMGNPDLPTPSTSSTSCARRCATRAPTAIPRRAAFPACARPRPSYYGRRFGVKLNPDTQVVATLGSKEGFANMAQAITAPGDVVLVPNPTYPIHAFGFIMSGGVVRSHAGRAGRELHPRARARRAPFDPEADGADPQLPVQPDGATSLRSISTRTSSPSRASTTSSSSPISPIPRSISTASRRLRCSQVPGAIDIDRRVHLDVEDLFHARLAHGLCRRQRAADRGADAGEVLSRLRRLHADPGGGHGRAQRRRRRHRGGARRSTAAAAT